MKLFKRILCVSLSAMMIVGAFSGCKKKGTQATIEIENFGTIKVDLLPKIAPKAVENFVTHAKDGYYNGLTFHRVLKDFMIQGGDPKGNGTGGESIWTQPFEDEFSDEARNFTGALSMANSGANTNGSQFFIVSTPPHEYKDNAGKVVPVTSEILNGTAGNIKYSEDDCKRYQKDGGTPWLDNKHTVFGYVTEGLDIVQKVMATPVGNGGMPNDKVVIKSITIK